MTEQHPITPTPELVRKWAQVNGEKDLERFWMRIATQAARWGADQELEAWFEAMAQIPDSYFVEDAGYLLLAERIRAARRPKPPSLKERALADLDSMSIEPCLINGIDVNAAVRAKYDTIRRALKQLPD